MTETDIDFHRRRARQERLLAVRTTDDRSAAAHRELAELHAAHVERLSPERPTLRLRVA